MKKSKVGLPVKDNKLDDSDYRLEDLIIDSFLRQRRMDGKSKKCYIRSELKSTVKDFNGHVGQPSRVEFTSVAI